MSNIVPQENIEKAIYIIRKQKVMLDRDLAILYGVETRQLKRQVRRNIERFPKDFMFILSKQEVDVMVCHFGTPFRSFFGGARPYAFTEHGILMLSSVLKSKRSISVNIQIMRTYTRLKKMIFSYEKLQKKIEGMEKKYDRNFKVVFDAIRELIKPPLGPEKKIGFLRGGEKDV